MQRISESLTGNHALSWLLKMPSIKKKMPSLSTNQRSVILPFIDKNIYCNSEFHAISVIVTLISGSCLMIASQEAWNSELQ